MASSICVDASLALKLVLAESESDAAQAEWQSWLQAGVEIVAPDLFIYETVSVLRNRVYRREITPSEADEGFRVLTTLDIRFYEPAGIRQAAWELARRFNRPTVYDAFYLALAQEQGCEFWTGDKRLYNSVKSQLKWVHTVGT